MKISPKFIRLLKRSGMKLRKAAPTILVVGGVGAVLAGTVTACVATTKTKEIMDDHNSALAVVENSPDHVQSVKRVYFSTIFRFIKLYAPSAAVLIVGLVMIFGSHSIMQNRNALLSAELFSVTQAFNAYREKVKERFGAEADDDVAFSDIVKTDENGNSEIFENKDEIITRVKYFSKTTSDCWVDDIDVNMTTLLLLQQSVQEKIDAGIDVFENEIYQTIRMPITKTGCTNGILAIKGRRIDFKPKVVRGEYKTVDGEPEFVYYKSPMIRFEIPTDGNILGKMNIPEV